MRKMKKTIKLIILIAVILIGIIYLAYQYEEKTTLKNEVTQMKYNMVLLKILNQGETERVGKLLSYDVQRAIIYFVTENHLNDIDNLCEYIDEENIELLKVYDKNISVFYINKVTEYCSRTPE